MPPPLHHLLVSHLRAGILVFFICSRFTTMSFWFLSLTNSVLALLILRAPLRLSHGKLLLVVCEEDLLDFLITMAVDVALSIFRLRREVPQTEAKLFFYLATDTLFCRYSIPRWFFNIYISSDFWKNWMPSVCIPWEGSMPRKLLKIP